MIGQYLAYLSRNKCHNGDYVKSINSYTVINRDSYQGEINFVNKYELLIKSGINISFDDFITCYSKNMDDNT